jgi:hypothetical protein
MIDPQRYIIDHRKRSKSLGQAAQFNGRQSNASPNPVPACRGIHVAPLSAYLSLDQYKHE